MALSAMCEERLYNFKFESAEKLLGEAEPTGQERRLVEALAAAFGNSGWLDGHMNTIVAAAVNTLLSPDPEVA